MTAEPHTTSIRPITSAHSRPRLVVVWDPVVRIFHWLVVTGFMANMFVAEEGKLIHRWIGYGILALIVVRLLWGFAGTAYARFSNFVPTASTFWGYVRALSAGRKPRYIGHNPAAAVMMITLVLLIALCGVTGWMQGLDVFWDGMGAGSAQAFCLCDFGVGWRSRHCRGRREPETSRKSHLVYDNGAQTRSRWLRRRLCVCFS